jgi:hypothetical protein
MTELTPPSRDAKRPMLGAPPVVCARNCPFRVLCDAASGPQATTPVAVDLPSGSAAATCLATVADAQRPRPRAGGATWS